MLKPLIIGNKKVNFDQPTFIIAEAGVNHNGRLDLALKLIDSAADAGADAIKFQTWRVEDLVTKFGKMASYQKRNLKREVSQFEMLKSLELKEKWYPKLIKRAKEKKIILLSTPHGGFEAVDLMQKFNFPAFKFSSGDITNLPLLDYAAKKNKPMLISTGMANMDEVKEAIKIVKRAGNEKILIFQCTSDYPAALKDVNLRVIQTFKEKFAVLVGYSDHTMGDLVPIMAVTLGACMIEKHLTLDRKMRGPDHVASMEQNEFKEMVLKLKQIKVILGDGKKRPAKVELQYLKVARKSIVAKKNIKKGEEFTKENLSIKRPGSGMSPKLFFKVLGKVATVDISQDTLLSDGMVG